MIAMAAENLIQVNQDQCTKVRTLRKDLPRNSRHADVAFSTLKDHQTLFVEWMRVVPSISISPCRSRIRPHDDRRIETRTPDWHHFFAIITGLSIIGEPCDYFTV